MAESIDFAGSIRELRDFLDGRGWSYCLIGGLAAMRWGQPRLTRDIDLVLFTGVGDEATFVNDLVAHFRARIAGPEGVEFALRNRVLLLTSTTGVPIDISLGALEFEEQMVNRANSAEIIGRQKFRVASAEDIIVMKTVAGRPQDWQDIEGIIVRQGRKLDWPYIEHWLGPMLDLLGSPQRQSELIKLKKRLEGRRRPSPRTKRQSSPRKKKDT
jgi:hypothetical protein